MAKVLLKFYGSAIAFSLIGAFLSKTFKVDSGGVEVFASLAVLVSGALYIAFTIGDWRVCLGVMGVSGLIEAVGVSIGWPFGSYSYTEAWPPVFPLPSGHLFPLALPLAWLLVAGASWVILGRWLEGAPRVLASGILTMIIDIPLEDVMTKGLGYWKWNEGGPIFGAPVMNSLGWLGTGLICAFIFSRSKRQVQRERSYVGCVFGAYCLLMGEMALLEGLPSLPLWILLALGFAATDFLPGRPLLQEQTA